MDNFLEYMKKRKAAIRKELAELEAAERIYLQSGTAGGDAMLPFEMGEPVLRPTIKEGIILLLEEAYPMGLTALEILDRLNRRWWRGELQRTSLSPQITRLKKAGKVTNERGTWKLPSSDDAPPEESDGAS